MEKKGKEMEAMLLSECTAEEVKTAKEVLTKMYKKLYKRVNDQSNEK